MAPNATIVLALTLMACFLLQLSAAADDPRCRMSDDGMRACMPTITTGTDPEKPASAACCAALAGADMQCLCRYKDNPLLPYFGIDRDLAMKLPAKCKLPSAVPCK